MVLKSLLLELGNVLVHGHAILFRIGFDLLSLPLLELMGGHAALLRLHRDLLLHSRHLLWCGLLTRWWNSRHVCYFVDIMNNVKGTVLLVSKGQILPIANSAKRIFCRFVGFLLGHEPRETREALAFMFFLSAVIANYQQT